MKLTKKLSYKISLPILAVITLLVALIIYTSANLDYANQVTYNAPRIHSEHARPITQTIVSTSSSQTSLDYLFAEKPVNTGKPGSYSNVVGYFAHGAFGWYVPAWIDNWKFKEIQGDPNNQGMILAPRDPIANSPISDINIYVATSTETFNAVALYQMQKDAGVVVSEVLLSQHVEGGVTIIMEENTRIYHVQTMDLKRMTDIYYLDGNGKTASISFSSNGENFLKYSAKIREMVEGIGELRAPQG